MSNLLDDLRGSVPRKKNKKRALPGQSEYDVQKKVVAWLQTNHPSIKFKCDFLAGAKLPIGLAVKAKKLGNTRAWPDLFVALPKMPVKPTDKLLCGLFLELNKEGETVFKKDGSIVANPHFREQHEMLRHLRGVGYEADFAVGFEETIKKIQNYVESRELNSEPLSPG
mgnify:CR=1 FL=1